MLEVRTTQSLTEAVEDGFHDLLKPDDERILILQGQDEDHASDSIHYAVRLLAKLSNLTRHRVCCEQTRQEVLNRVLQVLPAQSLDQVRGSLDTLCVLEDCPRRKELDREFTDKGEKITPFEILAALAKCRLRDKIVSYAPYNVLVAEVAGAKVVIPNRSINNTV